MNDGENSGTDRDGSPSEDLNMVGHPALSRVEVDSLELHTHASNTSLSSNRLKILDVFLVKKQAEQQSSLPPTVSLKTPPIDNSRTKDRELEHLNVPLDVALHSRAIKPAKVSVRSGEQTVGRKSYWRTIAPVMLVAIVVVVYFLSFRSGPLPKLIEKEFNGITFLVPQDADLVASKSTTLVRLYTNGGKDVTTTNDGDGIFLQKDNSNAYYAQRIAVGDYQDVVTGDFENKQEVLDQLENIYKKTDSETDDCLSGFSNDFTFKDSSKYEVEFTYHIECKKNKNDIPQVETGHLIVKDRVLVFVSFTTSLDLYSTEKDNIEKIMSSMTTSL